MRGGTEPGPAERRTQERRCRRSAQIAVSTLPCVWALIRQRSDVVYSLLDVVCVRVRFFSFCVLLISTPAEPRMPFCYSLHTNMIFKGPMLCKIKIHYMTFLTVFCVSSLSINFTSLLAQLFRKVMQKHSVLEISP